MGANAGNPTKDLKLSRNGLDIPATNVSIYEALYQRRMAWRFTNAPVPKDAIERMLEAAVWAPNHRLTEPWRFFILPEGSETRRKVADLAYQFSLQRTNNSSRADGVRRTVLDPPVVMFVYCVPGPNEEVTQENYAAVCCAAHNISLAGVAEGLAVTWETGGPTRHPKLKETLGAAEDWLLAAMLSIGVPAETPQSRRTPVSALARWLE